MAKKVTKPTEEVTKPENITKDVIPANDAVKDIAQNVINSLDDASQQGAVGQEPVAQATDEAPLTGSTSTAPDAVAGDPADTAGVVTADIAEGEDIDDEGSDEPPSDEEILLYRILVDCFGAPVFAVIRDTLNDEDPERWDSILRDWEAKGYYVTPYDLRSGGLTESGRIYARNTYGILPNV